MMRAFVIPYTHSDTNWTDMLGHEYADVLPTTPAGLQNVRRTLPAPPVAQRTNFPSATISPAVFCETVGYTMLKFSQ